MSCSEVMYQAYYPYLYQRPGVSSAAHPVPRPGPFSSPFAASHHHHHHHQFERFNVQRLPETAHLTQPSTSSVSLNDHTIYLHSQHHISSNNNNSSNNNSNNSNNNNNNNNLVINNNNNNNNISTTNSVSSTGCLSPASPLRIKDDECNPVDRRSTEENVQVSNQSVDDDADDDIKTTTQYFTENCVILANYNGDTSTVVDEHFSRALDNKTSVQLKGFMSPMMQRNFPPSFWNSQYQNTICNQNSSTSNPGTILPASTGHALPTSIAPATSAVNSLQANPAHHSDLYSDHYHSTDSWYHQYSTHHRAVHEYHHHHHNMAAQYGSLLLPSSRLHHHISSHAPCKSVDWQHHPPLEAPYTSYPAMPGLEAQESSKDLYWF